MKYVVSLKGIDDDKLSSPIFQTVIVKLERIKTLAGNVTRDILPAKETSGWVTFFTSIIPFIIIFILFFFLMNQAQGGGSRVMNFGKSKAKLYNEDKKKVRFKDVAGADEEKQELVEVVEFLKRSSQIC